MAQLNRSPVTINVILCVFLPHTHTLPLSLYSFRNALENKQTYFYYAVFLSIIRVVRSTTNSNRTYTYTIVGSDGGGKKIGRVFCVKEKRHLAVKLGLISQRQYYVDFHFFFSTETGSYQPSVLT